MTDELTVPDRFRAELRDVLLEHAATLPGREHARTRTPSAVRRAHGPRVTARRLGPALALAAVIAAAGLLLRSGVAPQPATAASVLKASAAALDRLAGSRTLGPDDYFYTRIAEAWRYAGPGAHPYVVRSIQEEWLARDGHGRSRYDVVGLGGAGAQRGSPLTRSHDTRLAPSARPFILAALSARGILLSYAQLRRLPTEPRRARRSPGSHRRELRPQPAVPAAGVPHGDPVRSSPRSGRSADVRARAGGGVPPARRHAGDSPARPDTRQHRPLLAWRSRSTPPLSGSR